jgi:hypothetical protein
MSTEDYQPIALTEQIELEYTRRALASDSYATVPALATIPPRPISKTPRVGTIVWGFIVLAVGLGLLASALGQAIDYGLALILLLAGAGVALLAAALISGSRRSHR